MSALPVATHATHTWHRKVPMFCVAVGMTFSAQGSALVCWARPSTTYLILFIVLSANRLLCRHSGGAIYQLVYQIPPRHVANFHLSRDTPVHLYFPPSPRQQLMFSRCFPRCSWDSLKKAFMFLKTSLLTLTSLAWGSAPHPALFLCAGRNPHPQS